MNFRENTLVYAPKRRIQFPALLWFTLAMTGVLIQLHLGQINNYLIFKNVFWHTLHQVNLYAYYPKEYLDLNHYGPLFSIIIAPFAILPDWLGVILWAMFNAWALYYAIKQLPISIELKNLILLICSVEMMTSIQNVQFNPILTSWILLTFICILKDKTSLACLFISAGFLVKIYGIVGIVFFFFSKDKLNFAKYLFLWMFILFCLPMFLSSPSFILQTYIDWYHALAEKNSVNVQLDSFGIDISVMGLIRRIFNLKNLHNSTIIFPAILAIISPLFRINKFENLNLKLAYLSLVLISVVIFSSSAESPTYIIAVTGVAIWYATYQGDHFLLVNIGVALVILFTSIATTDLFPKYIRIHYIIPYSLKGLPCFIVWLILIYQLLTTRPVPTHKLNLL